MNWLPSLRAIVIFAILMAFFAVVYWACGRQAQTRHVQTNSAPAVFRAGSQTRS
jgi:cbb3-type cytochrome oxidase subunit 3